MNDVCMIPDLVHIIGSHCDQVSMSMLSQVSPTYHSYIPSIGYHLIAKAAAQCGHIAAPTHET